MKPRPASSRPKQPTPRELTDELLGFLHRKFYQGEAVQFAKDRSRLLAWVVLWPAAWLNGKRVSIPTDRYHKIFTSVLLEAIVHGTEKPKYLPAWLRMVVQSHFRIHGEEIYNEAKSVRSLVENTLLLTGRPAVARPDPIRELARAHSLLVAAKRQPKSAPKEQLSLL